MSESSTMSIPQAYWSPCISATIDMWHRQLSHHTSCVFNFLASKNKIACPLGKSSCLLWRLTGHKTTAPLNLIFSDVWSLAPMFFFDSFCYFVIFVDVYTNHIWYYPLVMKSDVFSTFHRFQVFVEHKFSQKK